MAETSAVRICSAQIAGIWDDPKRTLQKIGCFVQHAARSGAALIAFPEQFLTGWDPQSSRHSEPSNGSIVTMLKDLARVNHIAILGSFRERRGDDNDPPYNTAIAIDRSGGILTAYAKVHLFTPGGESEYYSQGSELGIFRLGNLTCGIAICYDLRFPELFRIYAQNGVQAMFIPAAWPEARMRHWELFIAARACENQMYVTGINTTGISPVDTYSGGSMTADPLGLITCRAGRAEELLFCDLDPALIKKVRASLPFANDSRHDLYSALSVRER